MNKPMEVQQPIQREESAGYDRKVIDYIHRASATGLYEIRGLGAKRHLPHFDDLVFLAASLSRYPLEGYREKCVTRTVLGSRLASKPIELAIPITIAGMLRKPAATSRRPGRRRRIPCPWRPSRHA